MGIFEKFLGNSSPKDTSEKSLAWIPLTQMSQLDAIALSQAPVLIFKHSTRCGISNMVVKDFQRHYDIEPDELGLYFLDLLAHRNLSDEIARRFGVVHQSPQIILLRDGKCFYTASHSDIDANLIKEKIRP